MTSRILIVGDASDPHTNAVCSHLSSWRQSFEIVDVWQAFSPMSCSADRVSVTFTSFDALWLRTKPRLRDRIEEEEAFAVRERKDFLLGMATITIDPARMINCPWAQERARNKIIQLATAREIGWSVPETIVGNDPSAIRHLFRDNAEVIYKPVTWLASSDGKILFTNTVSEQDITNFSKQVGNAPGIYQRRVPKKCEYRITVIGKTFFVVRIYSQEKAAAALDWRRLQTELRYELCNLSDELTYLIHRTMVTFGLTYAAIDLIETPRDEYVFLEANPAGNWLWLEERVSAPISREIAERLVR